MIFLKFLKKFRKMSALNILISGDSNVGKKTIINTFLGGYRVNEENSLEDKTYHCIPYDFHLFTEKVWEVSRTHVDILFMVLDMSLLLDDKSRTNIFEKTWRKIEYYRSLYPKLPIIMIGNKCDLLDDDQKSFVCGKMYRFHQTHFINTSFMSSYHSFYNFEEPFISAVRLKLSDPHANVARVN